MPLTPGDRKAEMVRRGITQKAIAGQLGVSAAHVHDVIHDNRRSERVENAIAAAIGMARAEVFPAKQTAVA